jgi:hypothetical protein
MKRNFMCPSKVNFGGHQNSETATMISAYIGFIATLLKNTAASKAFTPSY